MDEQRLVPSASDRERLASFDAFACDVRRELAGTADRMAGLREQGKVKTATYRQLFTSRETLRDIDRRLRARGL